MGSTSYLIGYNKEQIQIKKWATQICNSCHIEVLMITVKATTAAVVPVCMYRLTFSFLSLIHTFSPTQIGLYYWYLSPFMESSSSSHNTAVSSSSRLSSSKLPSEQNVSKQNLVLERPYELEALYGETTLPQTTRRSWLSRTSRSFVNRNPRTGAWITKAALYVRGPRPKVDLPRAFSFILKTKHTHLAGI